VSKNKNVIFFFYYEQREFLIIKFSASTNLLCNYDCNSFNFINVWTQL